MLPDGAACFLKILCKSGAEQLWLSALLKLLIAQDPGPGSAMAETSLQPEPKRDQGESTTRDAVLGAVLGTLGERQST